MPTRESVVAFIGEQMSGAGAIATRKMFGEYGVYCDGTFIGVIGGDTLFLKITLAGDALAAGLVRQPPYPGAKDSLVVPPDRIEDADWLVALTRATRDELASKPKRR